MQRISAVRQWEMGRGFGGCLQNCEAEEALRPKTRRSQGYTSTASRLAAEMFIVAPIGEGL